MIKKFKRDTPRTERLSDVDDIMTTIVSKLKVVEPIWDRFSFKHYKMKRYESLVKQYMGEPEPVTNTVEFKEPIKNGPGRPARTSTRTSGITTKYEPASE